MQRQHSELVPIGEALADLGGPVQIGQGFTDRNQAVSFRLHGPFSHARKRPNASRPAFRGRRRSQWLLSFPRVKNPLH